MFGYQWLADDADIQGETAATYTLVTDDVGKAIKVRVSFDDDATNEETLNSAATAAVAAKPNSLATGAPTISGTAQVGETLTANTTGISDEDGLTDAVFSYQWLADDAIIQDATASTYTLVTDDVDKAIKVKVTFTDDATNEETLTSTATAAVAAKPNSLATGAPTISGTAQVGETLTAHTKGISDEDGLTDAVFGYQWLADDADIQGETASTYTLVTDDVGKAIKVRVSFTDDATHEETLTSAATAAVAARPNSPATGAPTISGTAQVGETLTANTTGISDKDGLTNAVFAYQWLADDANIQGETNSTYTLVTDDVGKAIKVRVTFTDDATNEETLTSAAAVAARPNNPATGAPTIRGTAQVGRALWADTSGISDADGLTNADFSYQWVIRENGTTDTDIEGRTGSTYTPAYADEGKTVKVRVTFDDDRGNPESLTSEETAAVNAPPPPQDKHGDTPETATDILFGTYYGGRIQPHQDQDWFRLDVKPDQAGYTKIYFNETSGVPVPAYYARLALYDSSGSCMVGECEFDNGRFGTLKVYLDPGVYFLRVTGPVDDSLPTSVEVDRKYWIAWQRPWDKAWYDECAAIETGFDDPLYGCQTNLINQAHPGEHINVAPVWEQGILGEDIIVALVDFGVDQSHEDLVGSIDLAHSTTYAPDSGWLYPLGREYSHGTIMAGIIGAQHNSLGIRGIAPKSLIYSYYNPSNHATFRDKVGASLALHAPDIAVSSNSWAFKRHGYLRPTRQYTEGPILDGITRGFHGKGTVYVMGADYEVNYGINSNYSETKTLYAVVPVCGVGRDGKLFGHQDGHKTNWMGYGANLWICAPLPVIATDLNNGYRQAGGTSSATASVSGVVALVRSVNPDLTWRDVKLILAASARQNDPGHQDWDTGVPHYGGGPGRYHFNDNYGFGVVDAAAAVSLAKSWTNLPPMTEAQSSTPTDYSEDIPEYPTENDGPLQVWFEIADDGQTTPQFVEHVEIDIAFDHPSFHDLDVRLTSPSGTVSRLSWPESGPESGRRSIDHSHSFGSSKHLGENPVGQWQLSVIDLKRYYRGKLNASSLTIRGHRHAGAPPANSPATGAPTISGNAQVGETLTVSTSAISDQDGTSAATFAYQWISNGADTNSDIEGADGSAYIPTPADAGSVITVRVTFTDDLGQGETLTSLPTRAVAPLNTSATGAPVISGTAQVGETLTADTSGIADEDGIESADFQLLWLADDVGIRWDASYTLQASEVGKSIQLRVFFTDDRGNEEMLTSAATAAVAYVDGPPGAPREVEVKAGDKELLVSWLPPAEENKAPVEQYRILYTKEGGSDQELHTTQLSQVIGNLTGGVPYRVQVTAKNAAGYGTPSDEMSETPDTIPLWSADMLVVEYTDVSIGADSADLFSNVGGSAGLQVKSLWSYTPDRDLRLTFQEGIPSTEDLTLQVGDLRLAFPAGSSGNSAFRWKDVDVDWEDGQTLAVRIVRTSAVEATRPNSPATGAPTISGTAQVGETLTAATTGIADKDGLTNTVFGYQWLADDADIQGETASTYTLVTDDVGKAIKVRVSFTDDATNEETLNSAATAAVAARPNSLATGAPTISGTAQVGETLAAHTTGIADEDGLTNAVFAYQWLADDADIQGETASTYTLVTDDVGKAIKMRVSFDDDAGNEETLTSAATAAVAAKPNSPATGAPTISGTAQVGETLTANTTGIGDKDGLDNVSFSYQWLADDAIIQDATASTYTIVTDDVDKAIKVKVTFTDDATNEETLTSAATAAVAAKPNSLATGAPTISGTAQVGETLTAHTKGISDEDGLTNAVFGYQWLADDANIQGETNSTYTLVTDDVGKAIKVRVSFTDDATNEETLTSAATAAVAARPNSLATGAPTIIGTARVGDTLTADVTGIADADGLTSAAFSYQWLADDADIAGATGATYTLVAADEGKSVKVRVTFTDAAVNEEQLTSASTGEVARDPGMLTGFALLDASYQTVVSTLSDGDEVGLPDPADGLYAIRVDAESGAAIGSVKLELEGAKNVSRTRDVAPYSLYGGDAGGLHGEVLPSGAYTLRATAYSAQAGGGDVLETDAISFTVNNPTTGEPVVTGHLMAGKTLTANTLQIADRDGLTNATFSYQWVRNDENVDTEIGQANGSTYTLTGDDEGKSIKVQVSFTDDGGTRESASSTPTSLVKAEGDQPTESGTTIYLTFDDGPHPVYTPQILDVLESYGARAMFFVTGVNVELYPEIIARMADGGHGIGNHTWSHERLTDLTEEEFNDTVTRTQNAIGENASPCLRPPYGAITSVERQWAESLGLRVVMWSLYTPPWDGASVDGFVSSIVSQMTDGSIALMHDGDGHGKLVLALDKILEHGINRGYRFEPVCQPPGLGEGEDHQNNAATGLPFITGTAQVGETLTADTKGIADEDGLTNASFTYQWVRNDGGSDSDIQNATASTYTIVTADVGKAIKVRVTFTDDATNEETLTSAATAAVAVAAKPNSLATGAPTISGTAQVGETLTANTTGIGDEDGLDNVSFSYQWLADDSDIAGATGETYTLGSADQGKTISVRVTFTDDATNAETLTSAPTVAVAAAPVPLTVSLTVAAPATHDGSAEFTFEIEFSEEFGLSYVTLRDHAFTVAGGVVEKAQRTAKPSNMHWRITVRPDSNADVTITLPITEDCNAEGAICTGDGRRLSNLLEFTVSGPSG